MDSLIQVSVPIFFLPFPSTVGLIFAKIAQCFSRFHSQYDFGQTPRTGNQSAWHSLEVSRTLSPASHKFLCICKPLRHEFGGGTSGCFHQQMEEPNEFVKVDRVFEELWKELTIRDLFFFHVHCKIWSAGALSQLTQRDQFLKSSRLLWTILLWSDLLEWALCQS